MEEKISSTNYKAAKIGLITVILALVLVVLDFYNPFKEDEKEKYKPEETVSGSQDQLKEQKQVNYTKKVIRIRVLKNGVAVPFIEYHVSSAKPTNKTFSPVTEAMVEINEESIIRINLLLANEDRWVLSRYHNPPVMPEYELEVDGEIISKSTVKNYDHPDGKLSSNYVFTLK